MEEETRAIFIGDEISQLEELSIRCKIKQFLRNDFSWFRDKVEELEVRSRDDIAVSVIRFFGNRDYEIYDENDRRCLRFFVNRVTGILIKVLVREATIAGALRALDLLIKPSWINV